jgi:hypothetical protein
MQVYLSPEREIEVTNVHEAITQLDPDKKILNELVTEWTNGDFNTWDELTDSEKKEFYDYAADQEWIEELIVRAFPDALWDLTYTEDKHSDGFWTIKIFERSQILNLAHTIFGDEYFSEKALREIVSVKMAKQLEG